MSASPAVGPRSPEVVQEYVGALLADGEQRAAWRAAIEELLPPHRYPETRGPACRWSNARGLWTLAVDMRYSPSMVLRRGWGGDPVLSEGSSWVFEDFAVPYVRAVLTVLGAIAPEEER